jgi:hypothetical protein
LSFVEDLIVLMWRTGGPQPVLGQSVLPVFPAAPPSDDPLEPELPPHQPLDGKFHLQNSGRNSSLLFFRVATVEEHGFKKIHLLTVVS